MRHRYIVILIAAICAAAAMGLAWLQYDQAYKRDALRFEHIVAQTEKAIGERLRAYEQLLWGGTGFIQGSQVVTRSEWSHYVDALNLPERCPGIKALTYIDSIRSDQLADWSAAQRADGAADFQVHPPHEADLHMVVTFIAPGAPNAPALGLDLASDPGRRETAERSRDEGRAIMTPVMTLAQDPEHQPAFAMMVPIYAPHMPTGTVEERRSALRAWVGAPFLAVGLMSGGAGEASELAFDAYDTSTGSRDALLYGGRADGRMVSRDAPFTYSMVRDFPFAGRTWRLHWTDTPAFRHEATTRTIVVPLAYGLAVALLTAGLAWSIVRTSARAQRMAHDLNSAFQAAEQRFTSIVRSSAAAIITADSSGTITSWNHSAESIFGHTEAEALGQSLTLIIPERFRAAHREGMARLLNGGAPSLVSSAVELEGLRKDGSHVPVRVSLAMWTVEGRQYFSGVLLDMTQHKRAEAALRASEELNRRILAASSDSIQVLRQDGLLLSTNTSGHELIACDTAASCTDWRHCWQEGYRHLAEAAMAHGLTGEETRFIAPCRSAAAIPRWWSVVMTPILDARGQPELLLAISRDISREREAEEALAGQRVFLEQVLEHLPIGVMVLDKAGAPTLTNHALRRLHGSGSTTGARESLPRVQDLLAEDGRTPLPPDRLPAIRALQGERVVGECLWIQPESGPFCRVRVDAQPLVDREGGISGVLLLAQDVTDQHRSLIALQESERRFRTLAETAPVGIFTTDVAGCTWTNTRWQDITGLSAEEALGSGWMQVLHPEDRDQVLATWAASAAAGIPFSGEFRWKRTDGEIRWVLSQAVPLLAKDGGTTGYIGTNLDITTMKRTQIELLETRDTAHAASRAKSDFLASMSHELRTPLNGIIGMSEILLVHALAPDQLDMVRTIRSSGDVLLTLINDILDLSKIEEGKVELEAMDFSPAGVLQECIQIIESKVNRKRVELLSSVAADVPALVHGDPTRFQQVLLNLLSNAVKFTKRGEVNIRLRPGAATGEIEAVVSDTGIGMSEEQRHRLFSAYSQADATIARRFGGTGLGLAISLRLCRLMGGDIDVDSTLGRGSRFVARFLFTDARNRPNPLARQASSMPLPTASGNVLIVDDDTLNRRLAAAQCAKLGLTTVCVASAVEALKMIAPGHGFTVVLMDCQMPDLDGLQATRLIRERESAAQQPRTPIVALTASAFAEDRERCLESGMDGFLTKPVRIDQLQRELWRWVNTLVDPE